MCLGTWKKVLIVPILKPSKEPKELGSYSPVSLTSVVVKLLERMIANRLYHWLEEKRVINSWQAGFQRGRSTEEQVFRVVQSIQDGWEEKPHRKTVVVTLDCSKAYDRVWKVKLRERLMDEGVPAVFIAWFSSFLEDRKACVRVGEATSKWRRMHEGYRRERFVRRFYSCCTQMV